MQNHYKTLGLTNAASAAEIRRAYRVLARRYHPDVNPNGNSEALFKEIAHAYSVLSDAEKKQQYDLELKQDAEAFHQTFERAQEALKRNQRARAYAKQQSQKSQATGPTSTQPDGPQRRAYADNLRRPNSAARRFAPALSYLSRLPKVAIADLKRAVQGIASYNREKSSEQRNAPIGQLALMELSISMQDAITGVKKTVELSDSGPGGRKVSVNIPPGVQTGSVVRLRSKEKANEEIVLIIRVENHSWLSLGDRGITMEIPLTIGEAIDGAKVQVPSFGDPLLVTVEPGTQSGKEVRLKGQGITNRDGLRGDLFIRFVVRIPDSPLPTEVRSATELFAESYTHDVRSHLPRRILEPDSRGA
jgi:curved DNA-binding protein